MKKRFYLQNFEEAASLRKKESDANLVDKYEKLYFLDGIPEENKLELSHLYEDFTKFLINVDNCEENFQTLFIPITKKLSLEFKETDFFEIYSEWCVISKLENDDEIFKGFIEYYKSKH
jgi:hypothetical protein